MSKGRKKQFNEKEALNAMTQVFWEKGFEGASYDDLVRGTGVQRYGLYTSFGDKRSAFILCLKYYVHELVNKLTSPMRRDDAGLAEVKNYFDDLLILYTKDPIWGCLVCNTVSEKIAADNEIKSMIQDMFSLVVESLKQALAKAQIRGQVSKDLNIQKTTHQLLGIVIGSAVMSRAPVSKQVIEDFLQSGYDRLTE